MADDAPENSEFTRSLNPFDLTRVLYWSSWTAHHRCWSGDLIPNAAGLYRIRRINGPVIDYIGQSGGGASTLRKRMGALHGMYGEEMPYTDPHTAAPALWALRSTFGLEFEVSVAQTSCSDQLRKGIEALVIALYRQEHGCSPIANFGRIPIGFRKSSGVSRKLAAAGRQLRGGKCENHEPHHTSSVPPTGQLGGDPHSSDWSGHQWSGWQSILPGGNKPFAGATGLYRIRDAAQPGLLYIGEGKVTSRLADHVKRSQVSDDRKGAVFAAAKQLEVSWVLNEVWLPNQRLELECDLIGSYVLATGEVPPAQFGGPTG